MLQLDLPNQRRSGFQTKVRCALKAITLVSALSLTLTPLAACGQNETSDAPTSAPAAASPETHVLMEALKKAKPGSTIRLEPGTYSNVVVRHFSSGPVTLVAKDPAKAPVFTDLTVADSHGLTFSGLEFDLSNTPVGQFGPQNTIPIKIAGSSDIHFDHIKVHGAPSGALATTVSGMLIRSTDNTSVTDSDFSYLHNAFQHNDDTNLTLARNEFHNLWDDAIRGGGSSQVTVQANHCYSNHPDINDKDHPDCIQFWTSNTKAGVSDIKILDNRYERGTGTATQFIFMGNELKLTYENVVISGNVGFGSLWNGIAINHAKNVTISNNTLISSCDKEYGQVLISRIVTGTVDGLTIENNKVGAIMSRGTDSNVTDRHNITVGCK